MTEVCHANSLKLVTIRETNDDVDDDDDEDDDEDDDGNYCFSITILSTI